MHPLPNGFTSLQGRWESSQGVETGMVTRQPMFLPASKAHLGVLAPPSLRV